LGIINAIMNIIITTRATDPPLIVSKIVAELA